MANKKLTSYLTARVTPSLHNKFMSKAKKYGQPSDIHREILTAFVEDRMTLDKPHVVPKEQLYK